ncbi:MAG: GHKL domain-containing protein [Olegusella sp.]|nr:GHKL domain-containing protein [Olegusella sp.]
MVDSAPALSLQAILSDPTVVQFLRQLSSQLVMWPSTYLAIMPVFRAGRISRRVYYGLLVASVALALSCSVVYVLYPDVRTAFFIGTSVAAIIVELALLNTKFSELMLLFFSAELIVYCSSAIGAAAGALAGETEVEFGLVDAAVQWVVIGVLMHFFSRFFGSRVADLLRHNEVSGVIWRAGWAVPLAMYVIEVLFSGSLDTFEGSWRTMSASVLFVVMYFILVELLCEQAQAHLDMERHANEQRILELQLERAKSLRRQIDEAARARHDLRHFQRAVLSAAERGDTAALRSFASEINETMKDDGPLVWSTNPTVDALVGHYIARARELGCDVSADIRVMPETGLSEMELTALVSNTLENAVEALEKAAALAGSDGERPKLKIEMSGGPNAPFKLDVRNSSVSTLAFDSEGGVISTKNDGAGMGTQIISSIVRGKGGMARFAQKDGVWRTFVFVPKPLTRGANGRDAA